MFKTIMTIIVTVLVVLFSIENFDHVPVSFVAGKPVSIRLVFVIAISGLIGYLIRHFSAIATEERLKRQLQDILRRRGSGVNGKKKIANNRREERVVEDFDDDEL
ncbi:MAG: hypothetical protein HQK64_04415 [Desulfamplus sp.]|nr:hypothetical protein [Desulfamplus sp.]MBF0388580.1 hypothetical protein [Desulfamplus sp.]